MDLQIYLLLWVLAIVIVVLLMRWLGAWMLRIDDVIKIQKHTLHELKKISNKLDENDQSNQNL